MILHQCVINALSISRHVRRDVMRDRNNRKNIGVTESYKAAAFVVAITQPPYPPSQQTKFILNPTIQGVQRNDEHDMMLQQLVDSPQMLGDRLQLDKERIKMAITERNKQVGLLGERRGRVGHGGCDLRLLR